MSTEVKPIDGTESQLSNHSGNGNETTHFPIDANGEIDEDATIKYAHRSKEYLDYCNEVADKLSQRQAFYTVDLEDILWKVQEWKQFLPRVEIFYAVKANTDPILLQLLTKLELSFDCASWGEIEMVLEAGASPENIVFAHTIKTVEELKFASEKRVQLMTFDNEDELRKIHSVYPRAKLIIRIIPTILSCAYNLSEKFGCTEEEAIKLIKLANRLKLDVVGISFHVGGLCTDPISYTSTIETSRRLFDVAKDIGFTFTVLDIGGGFFGTLEAQNIFYTMSDSINKALEKQFAGNEVRVIAEPGVYNVNSAFNLVCTVLGRRCIDSADKDKPKRYYYLNDGIYGSFYKDIHLYGVDKPIPLLDQSEIMLRSKYESRLYGQTCSSLDVIKRNVVLPELKVGERVVWCNMGAYCQGLSTTFCGIPLPIPRYVFVHKQRLNMDWITDENSITSFLKKHASFMGSAINDL